MGPTGNEGHARTDTQGRGTHTDLDDSAAYKRSRGWRRPRLYLPGQSGAFQRWGCEPLTWFCTIFSRQGRTSGLRLRGEGETTSARGLCFFHLPRRSDRGPRGEKPHRAAENAPGQWFFHPWIKVSAKAVGPEPTLRVSGLLNFFPGSSFISLL